MPYRVDMGGRVIVDADTVEEVQALLESRDRLRVPAPKPPRPSAPANHCASSRIDLVGIGPTRFKLITRRDATRIVGPFCTVCGERSPAAGHRCSNVAVIDAFPIAFGPID